MIVLGQTSQEKGKQLEMLTGKLLEGMGYRNVTTNLRGAGGEEIDVIGTYVAPAPAGVHTLKLICECKAHARPCDMNDWLKFLGKIFTEETRQEGNVIGCFIALSGVTGNVAGHYEDLSRRRPNLKLVRGEQLNVDISKLLKLASMESVHETLSRLTDRITRRVEPAFYQGRAYWIVFFQDDAFAILNHTATECNKPQHSKIARLVQAALPVRECISLAEENQARRRSVAAQKAVIGQLMIRNGQIPIEAFRSGAWNTCATEIEEALTTLLSRQWIKKSKDGTQIELAGGTRKTDYRMLAKVYQFFAHGETSSAVFCDVTSSHFYNTHINTDLLTEITRIQEGMQIHEEDTDKILDLLRWSPRALLRALTPDVMILRKAGQLPREQMSPEMLMFERRYFLRTLFRHFLEDFRAGSTHDYFYRVRGIVEVDSSETVKIKGKRELLIEDNLRERIGIGVVDESAGGGYISILLHDDLPEPWERKWPPPTTRKPFPEHNTSSPCNSFD